MFGEGIDRQTTLSVGDYWDILHRRRWRILLSVFLCWGAAFGISWLVRAEYRSEALILVEQQKVPEQYVVPNVMVNLQERLESMRQQILSRTRLQNIIDRYHLYSHHHNWFGAQDPVEEMRHDIGIEVVAAPGRPSDLTAFKVYYVAGSPQLAQQVNSELTSLFIDENLRSQQQLSDSTTEFLSDELAQARAKLKEQEAKVREFKAHYLGELPNQVQSNVQILSGLQAQLQQTRQALDRAQQQKLYLESLRDQYKNAETSLENGSQAQSPAALDKKLKELQDQLIEARSRYTANYPAMVALQNEIAKTQKLKTEIESEIAEKGRAGGNGTSTIGDPAELEAKKPLMQILSELKSNEKEIEDYQKQAKELEAQIAEYQSRLNLAPVREQQLAEISRGYEESQKNYDSLLQKQAQSALATNLQERQQGEQFRLIDPPSLPKTPESPNHFLISLGGLIAGVSLGSLLIAVPEFWDPRVHREAQLEVLVPAPVLAGIPTLATPEEERGRKRVRLLEAAAATAMVLCILGGNVYAFLISYPNKG